MSGTASVPTTFASAVTATGLQLDNNFSTVVAYLNDPTNRNNYAADSGTTNTIVTTFAPPVVGGYTAGIELTWKWAATNSGGVVLNANGIGNISVVNPDGTALQAGQGRVGTIGKAIYDGTRAVYIAASAQRQQEAKAWASWVGTATGAISAIASYNVTSITRIGTGSYAITLNVPMITTSYPVLAESSTNGQVAFAVNKSTATFLVVVTNLSGTPGDVPNAVGFVAYGQQ